MNNNNKAWKAETTGSITDDWKWDQIKPDYSKTKRERASNYQMSRKIKSNSLSYSQAIKNQTQQHCGAQAAPQGSLPGFQGAFCYAPRGAQNKGDAQ